MSRLSLREYLDEDPKQEIVGEPEAALAAAIAARFRAQARRVRSALRKALDDHEPDHDAPAIAPLAVASAVVGAFAGFKYAAGNRAFASAIKDVRAGAADIAAAQAGIEQDLTIPPYQRTPQAAYGEIDLTTSGYVLDAVNDAYAKGTVATLLDRIDEIFAAAVDSRAPTIASTEIDAAYNDGSGAVGKAIRDTGVNVEKQWNAEPDACEICQGNADEGWIEMDEPFSSGDDVPPAHPNCRCTVDLRTAEE